MRITFTVYGLPRPQGSVRPVVSKTTGRTFVKQSSHMLAWRQTVAETALRESSGLMVTESAVSMSLRFFLPRPKSVTVQKRPYPTVPPDVDKLCRLILDALTGVLYQDDAQVVSLQTSKTYGEPARVEVELVDQHEMAPRGVCAIVP